VSKREFWIGEDHSAQFWCEHTTSRDPLSKNFGWEVHVIEKQAYTNLEKQCEALAACLRYWSLESEWVNVPVEFQIERARNALKSYSEFKGGE